MREPQTRAEILAHVRAQLADLGTSEHEQVRVQVVSIWLRNIDDLATDADDEEDTEERERGNVRSCDASALELAGKQQSRRLDG